MPPPVNFQAGMQQQPGILQPAEADSTSIGRRPGSLSWPISNLLGCTGAGQPQQHEGAGAAPRYLLLRWAHPSSRPVRHRHCVALSDSRYRALTPGRCRLHFHLSA
jgi:hypothetical protein